MRQSIDHSPEGTKVTFCFTANSDNPNFEVKKGTGTADGASPLFEDLAHRNGVGRVDARTPCCDDADMHCSGVQVEAEVKSLPLLEESHHRSHGKRNG